MQLIKNICYKKGYEDRDKEIVRCKDCRYYRSYYDKFKPYYDCPYTEEDKHTGECNYIGKRTGVYIQVEEINFCSRGEKRETK